MTQIQERCESCGAFIDEEDLFCANCGREAPDRDGVVEAIASEGTTHNFTCEGCGASMSYDAKAQNLLCPFCGSEKLREEKDQTAIAPRFVVPMLVGEQDARNLLRTWMGSSFWRPNDLVQASRVENILPVYVPYWMFRAKCFTYWTADSSKTPPGARASWYPVSGQNQSEHTGLLVGASGVLTPTETNSLLPYDFSKGVDRENFDLDNVTYEQFRVARKYARPLATNGFNQLEKDVCRKFVPGNCRNLKVNVRLENMSSEPILLPVWIMAYQYNGATYRFLINGQTGKHTGTAPISYFKVALAVIISLLVLLVLLGCAGLIMAVAGR